MAALNRQFEVVGATLATTDSLGLPSDHKEAYAFALLGWLTWHGLPGSLASCTGASGQRILGTIVPGSGPLRIPEPEPMMPSRLVVEPQS
jgi:anhydro-N-acetylmuramic acid kinase